MNQDEKKISFEQRQNKILKDWIERNYGKECPDYDKDCANCKAWDCYKEMRYDETCS